MYEERKDSFSIRNVVIQFLFVALIIFICISLFPMKSDLDKAMSNMNKTDTDVSVLYDRIFNENVIAMKDAAKDYFTTPRLPNKLGETVKITLGEMLEKKIILPFVDKNGDQCDIVDSYVEVTKDSDEFVMKVNLKCSDQENYLLVHMGCYDYCQTAICEKNTSDVKTPVIYNPSTQQPIVVKPSTPDINIDIDIDIDNSNNNNNGGGGITPTPDPDPTKLYEYQKQNCGEWSGWSDWSTNRPTTSSTLKAQYRVVKITKTTGYKITKRYDYSQPIYEDVKYLAGTKAVKSCAQYGYQNVSGGSIAYGNWTYQGTIKSSTYPADTATKKYVEVGLDSWYCEGNCTAGIDHVFDVYTRSAVNEAEYTCLSYHTETVSFYGTRKKLVGYKELEPKKEAIKKTTEETQYRYATRSCTTVRQWSTYNDRNLLDNDWVYTGNVK